MGEKTLGKALAREYAAKLLAGQDEPDWLHEHIAPDQEEAALAFMDELSALSASIAKSITPAMLKARESSNDG
jgi:hypothetical protein